MAQRVLPFVCAIPAGTPVADPVTIPIDLDGWELLQLDLEVPPGASGLMGFQVYNNGVAWIPYGSGEWFVWDNVRESYPLQDQPNASGWAIVGYNLGSWPHTVTVRAHVNVLPPPAATTPTVVPTIVVTTAQPTTDVVTL